MALTIARLTDVRPLQPASAIVESMKTGAQCEIGDVVYVDSNGLVQPARANVAVTSRAKGIIVASAVLSMHAGKTVYASGEWVSVLIWGLVAGIRGLVQTSGVYLSSSEAGEMTQTPPAGALTWTFYLGYPLYDAATAELYLFFAPTMTEPTSNS